MPEAARLHKLNHNTHITTRVYSVYRRLLKQGWHRYFFARFKDEPKHISDDWANAVSVPEVLTDEST